MNFPELKSWVEDKKSQQRLLSSQLEEQKGRVESIQQSMDDTTKARWLLAEASKLTQLRVKKKIESLVTMAVRSVFDKDYRFICEFEIKRNKSEVSLMLQEGSKEPYVPKEDQGGGLIDVVSLALRVVLWSMEKPRSRNTFILDEPGKWTGRFVGRFGQVLKELSEKLGIQMIVVTHDPELLEVADRSWEVIRKEGSEVRRLGGEEKPKLKRRKTE